MRQHLRNFTRTSSSSESICVFCTKKGVPIVLAEVEIVPTFCGRPMPAVSNPMPMCWECVQKMQAEIDEQCNPRPAAPASAPAASPKAAA